MAARSWLLLLAPLALGAPRATAGPCPGRTAPDPARAGAIEARLSAEAEIVGDAGAVAFCFGPGLEPGVTPDGVILLPYEMPEPQAAARAAHLLHHRRAGSPLAGPPRGDCARWVEEALAEEGRAYALELRMLPGSPLPFAEAALAAPEAERPGVIQRWLREHPGGGAGVPALASDYATRCLSAPPPPTRSPRPP